MIRKKDKVAILAILLALLQHAVCVAFQVNIFEGPNNGLHNNIIMMIRSSSSQWNPNNNNYSNYNNYNNNNHRRRLTTNVLRSTSESQSQPKPQSSKSKLTSQSKSKSRNQQLGDFECLDLPQDLRKKRKVALLNASGDDPIRFESVWNFQKDIVSNQMNRLLQQQQHQQQISRDNNNHRHHATTQFLSSFSSTNDDDNIITSWNDNKTIDGRDCILMLQHQPVYTLGTGSDEGFIIKSSSTNNNNNHKQNDTNDKSDDNNNNKDNDGDCDNGDDHDDVPVVRIERGGEVTYHGPGQLVAYPILDLRGYKQDVHWYMRALEEAILLALQKAGIPNATREEDLTGVWVDGKKIAALGIKLRRWITMHGLAVNVEHSSITNFDGIVPCGLEGRQVCCINDFLEIPITVEEFSIHLTSALEDIFEIRLTPFSKQDLF